MRLQVEQHYINLPRLDRRKCGRAVRHNLHTLVSAQSQQACDREGTVSIIFSN